MFGNVSNPDRIVSNAVADRAASQAAPFKLPLQQAARRLDRIADRIESTIIEQLRQLDDLLAHEPKPANDTLGEAERAEFVLRQAAWERQKNDELVRIEQERNQLSEAWALLESEQRRMLAEDALRRAQAASTHAPTDLNDPAIEPIHSPRDELANRNAGIGRESVLGEYEQLRSDVQKHAKRLRRTL